MQNEPSSEEGGLTCRLRPKTTWHTVSRPPGAFWAFELEFENATTHNVEIRYEHGLLDHIDLFVRDSEGRLRSSRAYSQVYAPAPTFETTLLIVKPGERLTDFFVNPFLTVPVHDIQPGKYHVTAQFSYGGHRSVSNVIEVIVTQEDVDVLRQ